MDGTPTAASEVKAAEEHGVLLGELQECFGLKT